MCLCVHVRVLMHACVSACVCETVCVCVLHVFAREHTSASVCTRPREDSGLRPGGGDGRASDSDGTTKRDWNATEAEER